MFPCASCVKKGCAAICPDGSLTTGKGNRFVLANTEALHEKIQELSNRVRELEDALAEAHIARGATEQHPLLSHDLLQIKRPLEREAPEIVKEAEVDTAEAIDLIGSLNISESARTKFYGGLANAWYLLKNEEGGDDETENAEISLPADIPWLSHTFPFATANATKLNMRQSLYSSLPDVEKARRLVNIYYKYCAWMYLPIPDAEFYNTVFSRIYDQPIGIDQDPIDSHRLAVLYMVLALGTLFDLGQPYLCVEATQYYQLARAAISLDSLLEHQTIPAIQALVLMCHFMFMSFRDGPRWAAMGLVVKLAQSLGLHRDGGKWNLDPEEAYHRRSLFWEVYTYDSWQSLTFGRPPSFSNAYIDCQMPEPDVQPSPGKTEDVDMSFNAWKHRFSSRCLNPVHEQAFGARTPTYKTILELDKKVRNYPMPPSLRVPGFGGAKTMELEQPSVELTMQRHTAFSIKEITIFYLHRGFFARAIEDNPEDPLASKYPQSVLAAYTSACTFISLIKSAHSQHPRLTERLWFMFTHVFSCSIVLGSIAAKCPTMPLARSALLNLDSVCQLFEAVKENDRAAKVLPVLQRLKARALQAMGANGISGLGPSRMTPPDPIIKEEEEELAALGGKPRLVSRRSPSAPNSPQDSLHLHHTPSPHSSPVQPYPVEHMSPVQERNGVAPNGVGHWHGYHEQSVEGVYSGQYASNGGGWPPASPYGQLHPQTMQVSPAVQYSPFEQLSPVAGTYFQAHSPIDTQIQADPQASWQSFYAQYQPGPMSG